MVREGDELCITVPSLFRCPISLDVMRSPVSLCTGVTYERSSIQYWLESGHDTCPATMQILSTKEFIPNLTLHRLISTWSRPLTVSEREVRVLIEKVGCESESKTSVVDCLVKIAEFVSSREENRKFLARYGGFVDTIVGILRRNCAEIVVLESVVRVLDLVLTENGVKEKLNSLIMKSNNNYLFSILKVIHKGSLDSKIRSIKILDSISVDNESKRQLSETENLLSVLFDNLKTAEDENLDDSVLTILITLSAIRPVKTQLVNLGLVQVLSNTLWNPKSANPNVGKVIKLLSLMVTCSEGRCAVSEEPRCAAGIVEMIMKVKKTAREDGMVVLWSMCCLYNDGRVKEAVVTSNGVTKMLLVMQSENEGIVRRMCGDLIKVLGKNNSGLGVYNSKTTHIMPY
ncbi:hypothetical protein Dsin_001733 [Dipteronia sinensis]|uniref:U-box domain-containing protein n=1 Tax=Dipteronia sinensis TaxID=43782 RepID=A0AAE0EJ98_9ROSI|nr:hypothetical protein Dsin_001733 [Dipteronia sinensis]